ncbi:MAG: STAS domain-containing protein [Thermoplasmata archaeon]|nr:MAG: STAS domain-containing protein [Thermoplasmata archaeon]
MKKTKTEIRNDVAVISWGGERLIGEPDNYELRDEVKNAVEQGIKKIIFDFSAIKWTNSTGLGILVSAWKIAVTNGAELVVVIDSDRFDNIFKVTNLKAIMNTYRSIDDAVKYYGE